jgi:geranylgeranyl reductase family protein
MEMSSTGTYDAIVVGAGPGGASAAAVLAADGHDVLLVDREEFPREKTCGDGIPPGTIEILNGIGMADAIRNEDFYCVRGIRLGSPWGRTWDLDFSPRRSGGEFYIAQRSRFDELIRRHAITAGATFRRARVSGPIVEDGCVRGVIARDAGGEEAISARLVIGADGATSVIARALGTGRLGSRERGVAVRAYLNNIDPLPQTVEFYFDRELLPGYAWIFPVDNNRANVGVIMRADRYSERGLPLRERLDRFLARPEIRERIRGDVALDKMATWQLPYAVEGGKRAFDGALLVGDAGGFVDPLTGEGIHNAVLTGVVAAQVGSQALQAGDLSAARLAAYDHRCQTTLAHLTRRARRVQRFADRFPVGLELLFIGANLAGGLLRAWINRVSTDFVTGSERETVAGDNAP